MVKIFSIEIDPFACKLDHLNADQVILGALLESSQEQIEARAELCKPQLDRLQSQGLDAETDLRRPRDLVDRSVRHLEREVLRVTLKGKPIWRRQSAAASSAGGA